MKFFHWGKPAGQEAVATPARKIVRRRIEITVEERTVTLLARSQTCPEVEALALQGINSGSDLAAGPPSAPTLHDTADKPP